MQMSCQSKLLLKRLDLFIYLFSGWKEIILLWYMNNINTYMNIIIALMLQRIIYFK